MQRTSSDKETQMVKLQTKIENITLLQTKNKTKTKNAYESNNYYNTNIATKLSTYMYMPIII